MSTCPRCKTYIVEPEDEEYGFPCPRCGIGPGDEADEPDEDEDDDDLEDTEPFEDDE